MFLRHRKRRGALLRQPAKPGRCSDNTKREQTDKHDKDLTLPTSAVRTYHSRADSETAYCKTDSYPSDPCYNLCEHIFMELKDGAIVVVVQSATLEIPVFRT